MQYQYTVKSRAGALTAGVLEAASPGEARQRLLEQGLYALSLVETAAGKVLAKPKASFGRSRVRKTDLLMVTCQLHVMSQAGIDLAEAIRNVATNCEHPVLGKLLLAVHDDVSSGQPFSSALRSHSHVFSESYIASIAAAEASGTMTSALARLSELLRNEIRTRGALASALSYPIALSSIALLVVAALLLIVLPQFANVFRDLGTTPPPFTQMLLAISEGTRAHLLLIGGVGVGVVALVYWLVRRGIAGPAWDRLVLFGPLVRNASRPLLIGQTFRLLATMLQSGVPLLDALRLCRTSVRNSYYRSMFKTLEAEVETGRGISDTLALSSFIPAGAAQMARTAEKSGRLGEILETIGQFYEEEGGRILQRLVKLLEPVIIIVMGLLVATVVASVMLPLLDVATSAR